MKLKLFGFSIIEIERDSSGFSAEPRFSTHAAFAEPPSSAPGTTTLPQSLSELHQSAEMLPRTRRGTIDVEASLQWLGISDPKVLWQQRFRPGTAGTVLKCILGSQGRKPKPSESDQVSDDLYTYPAEKLPLVAGTGKLDLGACLAMFDVRDPSILWKRRFRPNSAGGRIKMFLRASGFAPQATADDSQPSEMPGAEELEPSPKSKSPRALLPIQENLVAVKFDVHGHLDIPASLQALGIADPRMLWRKPVEPGSAEHTLKKEIARVLGKRATVPGITRQDIGLTD